MPRYTRQRGAQVALRIGEVERMVVSGRQPRSSRTGATHWLRGINQGTWGQNYDIDAPAIAALGANHVRLLIRSNLGGPLAYETGVDAYEDNGTHYFKATHIDQFMQEIAWARAAGLWVIVAYDTDQGQGVGRADTPATGWDFFDGSPEGAAGKEKFFKGWEHIATLCKGQDHILAYELLPEPLPYASTTADAAPLRAFYREAIARVDAIDPRTPKLIGPRASYGANLIEEAWLSERTDCIYTIDALTNRVSSEGTIAALIDGFATWLDGKNACGLIQQLGRNTGDDIGDINADGTGDTTENLGLTAFNGALSMCNARRIAFTLWQYHQNTNNPAVYGLWFKTVYPGEGPLNWTPKPTEIASFEYHCRQTPAAVEAAAIAAATAASAQLFFVKSDLSNVFQDSAGTVPVTAIGDPVGRINAVVGSGNFTQGTAGLRPTLVAAPNGYALQFDGVDDWMGLNTTYFAAGDDSYVSVACRAAASAANRVVFQCGTSGSIVRNPYLAVLATDLVDFSLRGDDNVYHGSQGVTTCDDRAIVASGTRIGNNKKAFVNGVQEGTTDTAAVGTIASITRTRIGGSSAQTNFFAGPIAQICVSKTITDEQRRAIDRSGAWRIAAPFRGAIPA